MFQFINLLLSTFIDISQNKFISSRDLIMVLKNKSSLYIDLILLSDEHIISIITD